MKEREREKKKKRERMGSEGGVDKGRGEREGGTYLRWERGRERLT